MSEKIDIIIDSSTDVEAGNEIVSTSTDNNIDIEILEPDYNVTINKREYVIVGDDMYIPLSYDEAPQWLKDTIANITDFSLNQKLTEIGALSNTLNGLINELNIAKNTYTNSIITSAEIDERINARIETLNSSLSGSDATIVDLIATKATPTEASSLALNVLTASINDGAISSLVSNLQNAISTTNSTLANNIDIVHAEMTGEFNANAEVINSMQAYVGIDEAGASTGTGVSAYLEGSNGVIGSADSNVANNVYVDNNGNSRSKFEYNSSLNIGGTSYTSGFGLSNSAGTGVGSEFWINADKFKFTNNGKTGSAAPFTIDASGTTPQITFNGRVQFSNVDGYAPPDVSSDISANNDIFAQKLGYASYSAMVAAAASGKTVINGGYIGTNMVVANSILANSVSADKLIAGTNSSTVWTGGGLISQNFNGNPYGNIGTPSTGFRLSSNAAGTSTDPNIYGAYIKGATLEGTSLTINDVKVKAAGYSLNFGDLLILKTYHLSEARPPITSFTLFSDTYIAPSYSSGYNALRMCATTQVFEITCTLSCNSAYIKNLYLHYSTDGTNYTLLDSVQNSSNTSIVLISKSHYHSTTNNITFKVSGDTYYGSGTSRQNLLLSLSVKSTNNSG